MNPPNPVHPPRKRRSDGARSREAILREAAKLATVEGLDGLSIARLAAAVGMSKSGLFAHFGSKEELQLATIGAARALFDELVVAPAATAPTPLARLRQLTENYLRYVDGTFPGGCFFASLVPEVDTRPGLVRDAALAFMADWLHELETTVHDAQRADELGEHEDVQQLVFEIEAALFLGNALWVAGQGSAALDRARHAIERRLAAAAA